MIDILSLTLRLAGAGLILLAVSHIQIAKHLKWREEAARLEPVNASIFRVHTFFICLILVLMGLPSLFDPWVFIEPSRAGGWMTSSFAIFWAIRLYFQWFVYPADLWRGKRMETFAHWSFSFFWAFLVAVFGACACWQFGWIYR